jgi:hypothetical protein
MKHRDNITFYLLRTGTIRYSPEEIIRYEVGWTPEALGRDVEEKDAALVENRAPVVGSVVCFFTD